MFIYIFNNLYDLGVVAFVDYKIVNDRSGDCIIQQLLEMGAKVEKTFNLKVITLI